MKNINCKFYLDDMVIARKRLFDVALQDARHGRVLYIISEELNELPQLSQELNSLNKIYLKMITFLYVKNLDSFVESVSTLPDWKNVPSTIILDDLNAYCNINNLHNACGVVSFLLDTALSCSFSLKTGGNVHISVSKQVVGEDYCNILQELYCY